MRNNNYKYRICVIVGVALGVLAAPNIVCAQMPCRYEVTAIIHPPECPPFGIPGTVGLGISEPIDGGLPNVVGYYLNCAIGPNTAFVWIGNEDRFETLDFQIGTSQSQANDISADGTRIVGTADVIGEGTRGFLFDGKELTIIPPENDGTFSNVQSVNSNQITGTTSVSNAPPFLHKGYIMQDEAMHLIEPIYGDCSLAADIDSTNIVVGWMGFNTSDAHAFLLEKGIVTDLGPIPGGFTSESSAINDLRQIVGRGKIERNGQTLIHAYLWEDGKFMDLGKLPGFDHCAASDINNNTTIIGGCDQIINPNSDRPFVWSKGQMIDVNELIPQEIGLTIKRVDAINQAGQITGRGIDDSNDVVSFVLTPILPPIGDIDGDCAVSIVDLLMLFGEWGACVDCDNCLADLNNDCFVSVADLLVLFANWSS